MSEEKAPYLPWAEVKQSAAWQQLIVPYLEFQKAQVFYDLTSARTPEQMYELKGRAVMIEELLALPDTAAMAEAMKEEEENGPGRSYPTRPRYTGPVLRSREREP